MSDYMFGPAGLLKADNNKNSGIITTTTNKYTYDATLRKLKTVFEDKWLFLTRGSIASDVRNRFMSMSFDVLRAAAERLSIVNMCINCREQQAAPFLIPAREIGSPGFIVCKRGEFSKAFKRKTHNDKRSMELTEFLQQTGFKYDPFREDDLIDFGKMFLRELLTIDQVAAELQRNKRGEVAAFWLVDGATIARSFQGGYQGNKDLAFVQEIDGKIEATYTREEMVFDYMFKRASLRHRGYGYSLLEQSIDLVTTLIMGISYNRDLFVKDKIPKGFLAVQGDADDDVIDAIQRYWYAAMSGVGAKFKIPVLPSGKEGVSLDFKKLNDSNRDMEYHKLMLFFLSLFAAVFGIDLAELGIKTDNTQQALGENVTGRIEYSKSRGLKTLLSFLSTFLNKILRKVDSDYEFHFVGIDPEDEAKKYEVANKAIGATRTINEMREEDGQDPLEGEEYDTVLNPQLIQLKQFLAGQQQQEESVGEETTFGGEGDQEFDFENEQDEESSGEDSANFEFEKALTNLEEHLHVLKKAGYDVDFEV